MSQVEYPLRPSWTRWALVGLGEPGGVRLNGLNIYLHPIFTADLPESLWLVVDSLWFVRGFSSVSRPNGIRLHEEL